MRIEIKMEMEKVGRRRIIADSSSLQLASKKKAAFPPSTSLSSLLYENKSPSVIPLYTYSTTDLCICAYAL